MTTNTAILISGSGTNLQSIIDKTESKQLNITIKCVISNKKDAFGLERAKKHNIDAIHIDHKGKEREDYDKEIIKELEKRDVELVILAGFMRIISPHFIKTYKHRIINIHPALCPSFPGADGYGDAWNYGVKVSGCTIHFVDEGVDTGPIILQKVNEIKEDDTLESFRERGLKIEHKALPEAIRLYTEGKLKIEGRKVKVL